MPPTIEAVTARLEPRSRLAGGSAAGAATVA